ncbi:hypothetical protein B566_EDAN006192 [Ephemera danica]|nr:hypothetical protein B566_EDAN006192 [Ephemera danica]
MFCTAKVHTSSPHTGAAKISMTHGRSVSHQHVSVRGNELPFVQAGTSTGQIESPFAELWLPVKHFAIDFDSPDLGARVLEINAVGEMRLGIHVLDRLHHFLSFQSKCGDLIDVYHTVISREVGVKTQLVVASNHNFTLHGLHGTPVTPLHGTAHLDTCRVHECTEPQTCKQHAKKKKYCNNNTIVLGPGVLLVLSMEFSAFRLPLPLKKLPTSPGENSANWVVPCSLHNSGIFTTCTRKRHLFRTGVVRVKVIKLVLCTTQRHLDTGEKLHALSAVTSFGASL